MSEPHRFVPGTSAWSAKLDLSCCVAAVHTGQVGFAQCKNKRKYGEWCKFHDPEHAAQRAKDKAARQQAVDDKRRCRTVKSGLALATDDELLAEVRRRKLRMS